MAGAGLGAFGAGFAKSLTSVLMSDRERKREEARKKEDRDYEIEKHKLQTMFPYMIENIDEVDDEALAREFPFHFGGKQGKARTEQLRSSMVPLQQGGMMGRAATTQPVGQVLDPGAADVVSPLQMQAPAQAQAGTPTGGRTYLTDLDTGATTEPPTLPERRTLMGVPMLSAEERTERKAEAGVTETSAQMRARMKFVPQMKQQYGLTDAEARQYILTGDFPSTSTASMRPQSIRGQMPDGTPAFGIFDPTTRQYLSPDTGEPLKGFSPLTAAATQTFGVDRESIAKAVFDKRFRELTSQEAAIVLREEKDMLQKEASSRALGTGQGRFQAPADIKTAQETNVPVGTSGADVVGQTVPTMQQVDRRRSVVQLQEGLTDIRDRLLVALPKENELQGLAPGAAYALRRRLPQYRNQIASLESAINNVVNVMARSVGEQRGQQTERDALRAEAAIAQIRDAVFTGDTQESAKARITESLVILDRILNQLPQPPVPTGNAGAQGVQGVQPRVAPTPAGAPAGGRGSRAVQDAQGNWVIVTP